MVRKIVLSVLVVVALGGCSGGASISSVSAVERTDAAAPIGLAQATAPAKAWQLATLSNTGRAS